MSPACREHWRLLWWFRYLVPVVARLRGTFSPDGAHLHIAIADSSGAVIGGHLCPGSLVRTTAELVVGLQPD